MALHEYVHGCSLGNVPSTMVSGVLLLRIHPYKIMPWRFNQSSEFIHDGAMPWDVILRD